MHTTATSEKSRSSSAVRMHKSKSQSFFAPVKVQPKLSIGAVDDPYEREADAMADQVMRMPASQNATLNFTDNKTSFFSPRPLTTINIQDECVSFENEKIKCKEEKPVEEEELIYRKEKSFDGGLNNVDITVQLKCAPCEEEEKIQMKGENSGSGGMTAPPLVHRVINSEGQPLDPGTRGFMESRFGYDFGNVKVHNESLAHQSCADIDALAYTHGKHIVFGSAQYRPNTFSGKQLLAHELTHVLQQQGDGKMVQTKYKWSELDNKKYGEQIDSSPETYIFKGSAANTSNKKAFIIAGIHAKEVSPCELGKDVLAKLQSGTIQPDLHTLIIPCAVPDPKMDRGAGSGDEHVDDLNREFGGKDPSKNPIANRITQIVTEFEPDQTVSVHAISNDKLGGVYLDPKYTAKYPKTGTKIEKQNAFMANKDNEEAMRLTEDMIAAIRSSENVTSGFKTTGGNTPSIDFPRNKYPVQGESPFNILYRQQAQIDASKRPTSLGVWMAGLGKTILTIELPGYTTPKRLWQHFVPAIERFLKFPGNRAFAPTMYTEEEKMQYLTGTLDTKKSGLLFGSKGDEVKLNDAKKFTLNKDLNLREESYRCMEAMMKDAYAVGHSIKPFSGTRTFDQQATIWREKFEFTRKGEKGWGSMDAKSLKAKSKDCADLEDNETEWHSDPKFKHLAIHQKCWKSLRDEEKAREILKTSSGPGFSRHHWGTDIDINSDDPKDWETDTSLKNLYDWLTKNAYKYGYYQSFTSGRTKGYSEEKWHWSFAPISVPLQKEYENKILSGSSDGFKKLKDKLTTVPGGDTAIKLYKEYVEEINPDLRGQKKIDRPACMPVGTGADIPAWVGPAAEPEESKLRKEPKVDTEIGRKIRADYEKCLEEKLRRPAGVPTEEEMAELRESCAMSTPGYPSAVSSGDIVL